LTEVIQNQPEDASYEEILRELAFEQMITQGLKDSREGKTISNEEVEQKC
jgi:predicted transcriptional regulator